MRQHTDDDFVDVLAREHREAALVDTHDGQVRAAPRGDRLVGVHAHNQVVALRLGALEDGQVATVEHVKRAVDVDDLGGRRRRRAGRKLQSNARPLPCLGEGALRASLARTKMAPRPQ